MAAFRDRKKQSVVVRGSHWKRKRCKGIKPLAERFFPSNSDPQAEAASKVECAMGFVSVSSCNFVGRSFVGRNSRSTN